MNNKKTIKKKATPSEEKLISIDAPDQKRIYALSTKGIVYQYRETNGTWIPRTKPFKAGK